MSDIFKELLEKAKIRYWGTVLLRNGELITIPNGVTFIEWDDMDLFAEFGSLTGQIGKKWISYQYEDSTFYIARDEIVLIRKFSEVTK